MKSSGKIKMDDAYFFDTYAILEILKKNDKYLKYKDSKIVLTIFNLVELHYQILREFGEELANKILDEYSEFAMNVDIDIIKEANKFKLLHKKQKMSAPDVVGYKMAKKLGIKFLTGDKEFENLENVEFVK